MTVSVRAWCETCHQIRDSAGVNDPRDATCPHCESSLWMEKGKGKDGRIKKDSAFIRLVRFLGWAVL